MADDGLTAVWGHGSWTLYVGSHGSNRRGPIRHVVCGIPSCPQPHNDGACRVAMEGRLADAFDAVYMYLAEAEGEEIDALVCTADGTQRAPALVLAYIMRSGGRTLASAWHVLKARWFWFPCPDRTLFKGLMELELLLHDGQKLSMDLDDWELLKKEQGLFGG